jgi:hypothetical protein
MLTKINVPSAKRSLEDTVRTVFDAVEQATGRHIVIGSFPFWPSTQKVAFTAENISARDALAQLCSRIGGVLSYRLLFDPKPDTMRTFDYMMNFKRTAYVSPSAPPGLGAVVVQSR